MEKSAYKYNIQVGVHSVRIKLSEQYAKSKDDNGN